MGEIETLVEEWVVAEGREDAGALDLLLDEDFRGVGPLGFVLDKAQWLARYRDSDLVNESFGFEEADVRTFGDDSAVVVLVQAQTSSYRGQDASGRFRGSLVAVRRGDRFLIVHIQLSAMPQPPSS